jgi:hypothetical protein
MSPSDSEALRLSCPGGYCGERPHDYFHARFRCEDGPPIDAGIRRKNGQSDVLISEVLAWLLFRQAGIVAGRDAWANAYVNDD